ncbi:hypothetical protein C8F04DRAFT_71567 [Mycena alexandri]|uniref:Uncharacterized protein n=1 Tax=Mycena alexandri TaxID=1745969 RepID=A0AAD6SKM9_9AGAR|nr:hypothetical protein C8F04DRAFT_71567 [Mycena alexandri]
MPSSEEVKQLEGVSVAQHRFRLSVDTPENGSSGTMGGHRTPLPPPEAGANGPFLLPYRNSRYKEKFQALREKYDRVILKQEEYHQDLELATAKIKKLQAENDLLLDAMNLAASHQPSMFGLLPPPLPPDAPPGGGPMDIDAFAGPSTSAAPLVADRPSARHHRVNGHNGNGHNGNGGGNVSSSNGTRSGSSSSSFGPQTNGAHGPPLEQRPSRQPSIEFIAHDMNGRAP